MPLPEPSRTQVTYRTLVVQRSPMNLVAAFSSVALALSEGEGNFSGSRTLVGIAIVLTVLALVIGIGVLLDGRARS